MSFHAQAATSSADTTVVHVRRPAGDFLDAYRADSDYDYVRAQTGTTWWQRFLSWLFQKLLAPLVAPELSLFRKIVFYTVIAAVVGYALLRILRMEGRRVFYRGSRAGGVSAAPASEGLQEVDLQAEVDDAVARKDYRRAVRLTFLQALQVLEARGLVAFRIDKTNADYVAELPPAPLRRDFAELARHFEYVWYGDFPVSSHSFERMQAAFAHFRTLLAAPGA